MTYPLTGYSDRPETLALGLKAMSLGIATMVAMLLARPTLGAGLAILAALFAGCDMLALAQHDLLTSAYVMHGAFALTSITSAALGIILCARKT